MNDLTIGAILGFVVGLTVGFLLTQAWTIARTGHAAPMRTFLRPTRTLGIVLVTVALGCQALVGFAQINNGRDDEERGRCNARYNQLSGEARDERAAVAKESTQSELDLWVNLRRQVRSGALTSESFDRAISDHIRSLRATKRVRLEAPYPPPDFCAPDYEPTSPTRTPSSSTVVR